MNLDYIIADEWMIVEEGFDKKNVTASESLFSIGNGMMGQRANFEENYSGETFQGSYIGGIYYPDKTRVGWWKNGYPEYFAKVLNAPNWIGINVKVDGETLDLNTCKVADFRRELNMKEGTLNRAFKATLSNGKQIQVNSLRFLSLDIYELGAIKYSVTPLNFSGKIEFTSYLDAGIKNEDANYHELFWKILSVEDDERGAVILSKTLKTKFYVATGMHNSFEMNGINISLPKTVLKAEKRIDYAYKLTVNKGETISLIKFGGYCQSMNYPNDTLIECSLKTLQKAVEIGFDVLLEKQKNAWAKIWETADIIIEGDIRAQQAIRFNIFQLNQTYSGEDSRLNIGPKGFTGEKYGGSTYWDTEAYCIPFYMCTKDKQVARNLLIYRYNQLDKAIKNANKLGFSNGAALYPMVTINGEECHNEWEITFEEIHRNGSIIYAIYNYVNYTADYNYITEYGMEVMIGVSRFWKQRASFSAAKNRFMILGVTGPNEYENNVNNNWYTNYIARWCMKYTIENLNKLKSDYLSDYERIIAKVNFQKNELTDWQNLASKMYLPYSEEHQVYLQQDGFLDKKLIPVTDLDKAYRPINQKWSWDRILRSPYIKQADILQGFFFFENDFSTEELERHFDFYEQFTVHESSLSPCVHSIQAVVLGRMKQAYEFYLLTSRLDLDDYNHEVHEGLHITSMAGTWMSIVQGFGGMRSFDGKLSFNPKIPKEWKSYSFKINFRGSTLKVYKSHSECKFINESENDIEIYINENKITVYSNQLIKV